MANRLTRLIHGVRRFKPGQKVPLSGQYTDTDGHQVTCTKGEPFPPTTRPGLTWKLTDVTRH